MKKRVYILVFITLITVVQSYETANETVNTGTIFSSLDWTFIFSMIAAVSSIVAVAVTILIGLRSKQVYRPDLMFNMGLLYADYYIRKTLKNTTISTLVYYGASVIQNSEVVFICPYIIINRGKLPISKITLQLQYASKHVVKIEDKIMGLINNGKEIEFGILSFNPKWNEFREVQILNPTAQVRHTIPILRPGEEYVIPDLIKFVKGYPYNKIDNGDLDYGISKELAKKLRLIKKLSGFCVIDAIIYSESCSPITKRLKLLWFDTDSEKELMTLANDARKAFWGGKWPTPGLYFKGFWPIKNEIMVEEYGEAIKPKLEKIEISKNRFFYIENQNLLESTRNIVTIGMPPWNYLELHDDPDVMLEKNRYQRFFTFGQLRRINIRVEKIKGKLQKIFERWKI